MEAPETPPEPDAALTEKQKRAARRANWWHYHWGLVVAAVVLIASVVYVIHGLNTTIDPDYSVAVVTADTLPDASVQQLQTALEDYGQDRNRDGVVLVEVNVYTWSADASLTNMNSQMAGATRLNTDLANGYSGIWILADPAGFEEAYGALSETFGTAGRAASTAGPTCPLWQTPIWAATTPPPTALPASRCRSCSPRTKSRC